MQSKFASGKRNRSLDGLVVPATVETNAAEQMPKPATAGEHLIDSTSAAPTPRTDAQVHYNISGNAIVPAKLSRELERENAELLDLLIVCEAYVPKCNPVADRLNIAISKALAA